MKNFDFFIMGHIFSIPRGPSGHSLFKLSQEELFYVVAQTQVTTCIFILTFLLASTRSPQQSSIAISFKTVTNIVPSFSYSVRGNS